MLVLCRQGTQARDQLAEDACVFTIHAVSTMYWHVALPKMFYSVQLQHTQPPNPSLDLSNIQQHKQTSYG